MHGMAAPTGSEPADRNRIHLVLLPGDGVGPEVMAEAARLLSVVGDHLARTEGVSLTWEEALVGGAAIDATGSPLPEDTLARCRRADAVLLGAVGGPRWDDLPGHLRPEAGLLGLRKGLGLYANLRPVRLRPGLEAVCPIRPDIAARGVDLVIFRELTGGAYFGPRGREPLGADAGAARLEPGAPAPEPGDAKAWDTMLYTSGEVRRIARLAFAAARRRRGRVTSVDKANVLESSRLWRQVVEEVAREFPDVRLDHQLVDSAAMRLVFRPYDYDVILTENLFGDILSDLAAALAGSMGLLPSASLGEPGPGLYEPVHGSAPDIAGRGVANPLATLLSVAMMFRYSLGRPAVADAVEEAVDRVLAAGLRTRDIWPGEAAPAAASGEAPVAASGQTGATAPRLRLVGTAEMGEAVCRETASLLRTPR